MTTGAPRTYAAVWRESSGPFCSGELALADARLELAGSAPDGAIARAAVPYADLTVVRVGRPDGERLAGLPTLVLERVSGERLHLAPVGAAGALYEIGDLVADLVSSQAGGERRATVVAPIRPEALEAVRALLDRGPPFDPEEAGLDRHEVFLADSAVVFVFEGSGVGELAARLVRAPAVWRAAAGWRDCLSGRPRLAERAYSWTRRPAAGRGTPGPW